VEFVAALPDAHSRHLVAGETAIVLGVSLGASAIKSVLDLIDVMTKPVPMNQQTTVITYSPTPDRPWLDLAYQLDNICVPLVAVVLALFLLAQVRAPARTPFAAMGLDRSRPRFDVGWGVALAAMIGIPGLGLYWLAHQIGINTTVAAGNLASNWWTIPVYVLLAFMNGALEETVMIGYLFTRWRQAGAPWWGIVAGSALIRGTYHLYQGWGGFVGNIAMGVIEGFFFYKTKRVWPLIVAHTLLDVFSFIGYALLAPYVSWL
jgi:membrane protease YdiL (CAAX protease family)